MSTLTRFEDIESWRKARELANAIYALTRRGEFAKDFSLRDQIRRSAVSIMANIAEGFEREGNREFVNFLAIAKASLAETKSHLYLALDQGYITSEDFAKTTGLAQDVARLLGGFIRYLQQTEISGRKFQRAAPSRSHPAGPTRNSKLETRN